MKELIQQSSQFTLDVIKVQLQDSDVSSLQMQLDEAEKNRKKSFHDFSDIDMLQ
ncbi:hypothetical protein [Bacillus sp. JJ722]|uniref:hypothetical protein n=1 Tax=Bacillus sp. JJ722 TaxID=3122973 RepID=UPI003000389B